MKANWSVLSLLAAAFALAPISCGMQPPDAGGTLDNLDTLEVGGVFGLPQLPAPEGVDESQVVGVEFINEITKEQAAGAIPPALADFLDLVAIRVDFVITLNYEGGQSDPHEGSRDLEEFTVAFEAACPENIVIDVSVIASVPIPLIPEQTIIETRLVATSAGAGGDMELVCDSILRILATVDEQGGLVFETSIVAQ